MNIRKILADRRAGLVAERDALAGDGDNFDETAEARFDAITAEISTIDERLESLEAERARDDAAERAATEVAPETTRQRVNVGEEPNPVYRQDNRSESFFRDLAFAGESRSARDRLERSQVRALDTDAGDGGEFAPPEWMVDKYIELARAGRVTANLVNRQPLPGGVSSVNLPKIATGTETGVTTAENVTVTSTDLTTTSVSSGITTIAGGQTSSIQLLKQSGIRMDDVILSDLAMDAAAKLNLQVLAGTGANGQVAGLVTSGTTVTYTTSAPAFVSTVAAASLYNKIVKAQAAAVTSRFLPPDAVVMTPERWAWIAQAIDGNTRLQMPLTGMVDNVPGMADAIDQGAVGVLAGLPVYVDPLVPKTYGAATNQDVVLVIRRSDTWLYETPVEQATFTATKAETAGVYFRALTFAAMIVRHAASVQVIDGTGLVQPTL